MSRFGRAIGLAGKWIIRIGDGDAAVVTPLWPIITVMKAGRTACLISHATRCAL